MICAWCGGFNRVRLVESQPTVVVRCNSVSPYDRTARCRRAKGHDGACQAAAPSAALYLCSSCFGIYRETGERPPAFRMRDPASGPISGREIFIPGRSGRIAR